MARFCVSKVNSMADKFIDISLKGAPQLENITLHSQTVINSTHRFCAFGHHRSDSEGNIHTASNPSVRGTYIGVNSMGLISSLVPDKGQRRGLRFLPASTDPIQIKLSAYMGHAEAFADVEPIAEFTLKRHYVADYVTCEPVRDGRLRGLLFIPKNAKGKIPAILDMYGSGGGLMPHRAALLASKGFVTFSVAFFRYQDLPQTLHQVDLEYFIECLEYLRQLDVVDSDNIGAIALSLGVELIVQATALTKPIKSLVLVNGLPANMSVETKWKNSSLKPISMNLLKGRETEEGGIIFRDCYEVDDIEESDLLPIEKASSKILLVASDHDNTVPAVRTANLLGRKLDSVGRGDDYSIATFNGAGHLLEPAFTPFCDLTYARYFDLLYSMGGIPHLHQKAQIDFWNVLIKFLKNSLVDSKKHLYHKL